MRDWSGSSMNGTQVNATLVIKKKCSLYPKRESWGYIFPMKKLNFWGSSEARMKACSLQIPAEAWGPSWGISPRGCSLPFGVKNVQSQKTVSLWVIYFSLLGVGPNHSTWGSWGGRKGRGSPRPPAISVADLTWDLMLPRSVLRAPNLLLPLNLMTTWSN